MITSDSTCVCTRTTFLSNRTELTRSRGLDEPFFSFESVVDDNWRKAFFALIVWRYKGPGTSDGQQAFFFFLASPTTRFLGSKNSLLNALSCLMTPHFFHDHSISSFFFLFVFVHLCTRSLGHRKHVLTKNCSITLTLLSLYVHSSSLPDSFVFPSTFCFFFRSSVLAIFLAIFHPLSPSDTATHLLKAQYLFCELTHAISFFLRGSY